MSAASDAVRLGRRARCRAAFCERLRVQQGSRAPGPRRTTARRDQRRGASIEGRYRDGTIGQFTNIYALIRLMAAGRIHVLPASPCASLYLVPIDHVIGGLIDIAERMAAASGRAHHLVSVAPCRSQCCGPWRWAISTCTRRASCPPEPSNGPGCTCAERTPDRRVTSLYPSYPQHDPRFQDANCGR